jgi:hypothetical protein
MGTKLNNSTTVHVLAADLGLRPSGTPVQEIIAFCKKRVKKFLADFAGLATPPQLLCLLASKLGTVFVEIHSDSDLYRIVQEYVERGELAFANLEQELAHDVLGITFRLTHPGKYDRPFVSVIDCRGDRLPKAYFTKWHELGHLLILTDQRRLQYARSHSLHEPKSAEESLVDVLAGEFAYYEPMVRPMAQGEISFQKIQAIRDQLCPGGSLTSAIIGIAHAWPRACLLVEAKLSFKKGDGNPDQARLGFVPRPVEELRAVHVAPNPDARKRGICIYQNFRVPKASIIARNFEEGQSDGEALENLNWWRSTDGTQLQNLSVLVRAKRVGGSVYALIIPQLKN